MLEASRTHGLFHASAWKRWVEPKQSNTAKPNVLGCIIKIANFDKVTLSELFLDEILFT